MAFRLALRAAAAAIVASSIAAPPAQAASTGEFVALTYNVAGLPQGISGGDPQTNSPLISPLLNAYDLVLLQEDWVDPAEGVELFFHDEIVSEANHPYQSEPAPPPMGLDFRRFPTGPPMLADGLNRLSRFRFGTLERHMWEACFGEFALEVVEAIVSGAGLSEPVEEAGVGDVIDGGASDCGAQKGFSVARTQLSDGVEIDVYNLHADAGGDARDAAARTANFAQLARFMNDHSRGRAVIVGGDTNLHSEVGADRAQDRKIWEDFQAATGVSDVCRLLDCGGDAHVIDKFFVRSGGGVTVTPLRHRFERERFKREDGEPLSDHDPLAVRFAWAVEASGDGRPTLPNTGGPGRAPLVGAVLLGVALGSRVLVNRRPAGRADRSAL